MSADTPDVGLTEALLRHYPHLPEVDAERLAAFFVASDWLATRVAAERERADTPDVGLTEQEAEQIDFDLSEHVYQHTIANNIGAMGCNVHCRTRALKVAVDKVLAARVAAGERAERTFTADEVVQIADETSDSFGNLYRLDFIDRIRHEAALGGEDTP